MSLSSRRLLGVLAGCTAIALTATGVATGADLVSRAAPAHPDGTGCLHRVGPGNPTSARQRAFAAAATTYRVPADVLLGVSYLESRWDDHGSAPSTSGGYGPMHLTDVDVPDLSTAKGDGSVVAARGPAALHTLALAAHLTQFGVRRLKTDDAANICGGAAVLASYQRDVGWPLGSRTPISAWYDAVRRYSGAADRADSQAFADRVFATIRSGASRMASDGQRVKLPAAPALRVPATATVPGILSGLTPDCPAKLACQSVPAPYRWYGAPKPGAYGNHDLAHRVRDMGIDYIVIHDTEGSYATAQRLVTDPTYVSWNYTVRSRDGHVAQHLNAKDVGWHAGNWYINMHAIGIEHEGYAAAGASWYTEAMYQSSAALVRYLAGKYGVPLDRAHIIGHDQVPGITPAYVRGMHWDPGPYWNWQHYMRLLGAPLRADRHGRSRVVTVAPGFRRNRQLVTDCRGVGSGACRAQGTNFVYLHTAPRRSAPLVKDIGLHPDGSPSTSKVWDIGARAVAGQKLFVARRSGAWRKVWYLGARAWLFSPRRHPTVVPSRGATVSVRRGKRSARVFGRAYPEASAYPAAIPAQRIVPLQYTIKRGQSYVLADATVATDYYYAQTYNNSVRDDHTVVTGKRTYYEIWFGHRLAFVRAAAVRVR
jgi:N-acetylmuramoyl-L-alanine amidase